MTPEQSNPPGLSDIAAAIFAGAEMTRANDRVTEVAGVPVAVVPSTMTLRVLTDALDVADRRAEKPRRRKGTATFTDLASFLAHVTRFKDAGSVLFADAVNTQLMCVFDYHTPAGPRWCQHRSVYACPLSRQWKTWAGLAGKDLTQDAFAEGLDANLDDLANGTAEEEDAFPPPAAVVELARNLQIRTKGEFSRQINPTTGETSLVCKVEHDATSTKIPRAFLLLLPVFEGGALYRVEARVRLRLVEGRPLFAFVLHRAAAIIEDAFRQVHERAGKETGLPVLLGAPEAPER